MQRTHASVFVAFGYRTLWGQTPWSLKARAAEPELTESESEGLALLAQGMTNKAIAAKLGISEDAVKVRLKHAYEKLGVSDRAGAIAAAIRRGLARPEGVV